MSGRGKWYDGTDFGSTANAGLYRSTYWSENQSFGFGKRSYVLTLVCTSPVSGSQEAFSFANTNVNKPNDVGGNSSITGLSEGAVNGAVFDTRKLGFDF